MRDPKTKALELTSYQIDHNDKQDDREVGLSGGGWAASLGKLEDVAGVAEVGRPLRFNFLEFESAEYKPPRIVLGVADFYTTFKPFAKVELKYRVDGGPIQTQQVAQGPDNASEWGVTINAPKGRELEYWWKLTRSDGEKEYRSREGKNFKVKLLEQASSAISFEAGASPPAQALKAGSAVRLNYDMKRLYDKLAAQILPTDLTSRPPNSLDMNISAFVSFDGGKTSSEYPLKAVFDVYQPVIQIPADAKSMAVWFKGDLRVAVPAEGYRVGIGGAIRDDHRIAWDSNDSKNFNFRVEP